MLESALNYAALGVPVFRLWSILRDGTCACRERFGHCAGPGKHPATRWRHGEADELPTTDPARITAWWGPGIDRFGLPRAVYGIGMPTGETSGLFVIDLDNKPAINLDGMANLASLAALHGALPEGPVVATPSGGRHLYFRAPVGGGPTTASVAAPGIDTRGQGGMVVLAPSMHKSGKRYRWEKRLSLYLPDHLPEVPPWFLELLRPLRATASGAAIATPVARSWSVPEDEAAATLLEVLDSPYVRWMVEESGDVSREAWRMLATNLHAACAGHRELLELAHNAWHQVSASDETRYLHGHAEKAWADAASSPPISFEHASFHGAPDEICAPGKNLVLQARSTAMAARRSPAFVEAALKFLAENPGALRAEAEARGVTTRDLLIDEGFLEDTSGYVGRGRDEEEGPASPA